jgi:signal transduction histidine kinase/CheY-like chemotaxis protein
LHLDRLRKSALARPAILLALCVLAPLASFAAFNAYVALDRRQAALTQQSVAGVQALVENIDRQIATGLEDAETLAEAPALDPVGNRPANLKVFEEVARRTGERHPDWLAVVLMSPDGRWLFSTRPDDDAIHRQVEDWPSFQRAVGAGQAVAGDIVHGQHGKWGIPLRAPVVRNGKVVYVVTVVLDPKSVRQTLSSLRMPGPWITFVVDAQGHIVARLPDDRLSSLGATISAQGLAARQRGGGGSYRGHLLNGVESQTFYWMSPRSRWSAHAAIPRAVWLAPLRQVVVTLLGGFLICLLLAAVLVVLWLRDYELRRRQAAAVELATRVDALGRLTGGVAHDFNNLLTVIQGNAEILGRRVKGQPQAERPIAAIRAATGRAAKLTRQLLVFARGGPAEPVPVDLTRKVLDLLGAMSQLVGPKVAIETDFEPGLPPVSVDPLQLEAALLNLAANARDAMDASGMLYLRLRRSGDWVTLSARDEGTGFDPSILPRVFDPFFTTKPVGQGTGLGLSQVYGLVKGAGGRVEAANAPGGGAIVTLSFLPAQTPAPVREPGPAPSPPAAGPGSATVLLVDDNDEVRATTAAYLRDGGLAVLEAGDAAQALRLLDANAVEALVSDIVMPGEMDGMALADAIRAMRPGLPVLLVSGYSERAAMAHAQGFPVISKPYGLPELERRLRLLVEPQVAAEA